MRTEHIVGDFPPPPEKNAYPDSFIGKMTEDEYRNMVIEKLGLPKSDARVVLEVNKFRTASKKKPDKFKTYKH